MKHLLVVTCLALASVAAAQPDDVRPPRGDGPRGGGPGGMGGPGMMMQDREILSRFDTDGDGILNKAERAEARKFMQEETSRRPRRGGGMGGGPGGGPGGPPGMERPASSPGPRIAKSDVAPAIGGLYDPDVYRTIFLDFESDDWEAELSDFIRTDVEVPATMTVDGKTYPNVGVSFRGASSLMMVPAGSKRSFNISVDYADKNQRLLGVKTLNLLNANGDPSLMRGPLFAHIASALKIPAPRVNFVRVVVNGESWGVYQNAEQFDKIMIEHRFGSSKGARWKVPGSPQGRGGLEYLGEDIEPYRRRYEIKSKDDAKSWRALIDLCRTLNETPTDELEAALKPKLDIEGTLWFLALDVATSNEDGYWVRASDYSIYLDEKGIFHILPHDANETFLPGGGRGPGGRGGPPGGPGAPPGGPGAERDGPDREPPRERPAGQPGADRPALARASGQVDPLVALDDSTKPLRSRLLKVPALRESYLRKVRSIAQTWLDWDTLGPIAERYRALIDAEVKADTRKLSSYEAFTRSITATQPEGEARGRNRPSLEQFTRQRREYLLNHPAIKELAEPKDPA
ncbi:MAG: CotH kinase family protein [Phycisphaeraceae bacterium]|nr:CotH kinase family protein [Phycisphaeraceae bacterium]